MSNKGLMMKIGLPLLILAIGIGGMTVMVKKRKVPVKKVTPFRGVLVETARVTRGDYRLRIEATGTVQARRQTDIVPQVSGKVVSVAPNLVTGGFFRQGEELFAIEAIDFELAVERARANLSRSELDLQTVKARADIGREEWQRLHPDEEPNPLVVYAPQLKSAEAALLAARAALRQAELDLQRTRVTAPYNCLVRSENVDLGQYVRSGTRVATLVGTDEAEIIVPLPLGDLHWLQVPRSPGEQGSPAIVSLRSDGQSWQWSGHIVRSLGEVDPRGRMARLAVSVADPYGRNPQVDNQPELALGSFVSVQLQGATLSGVVEVPRRAMHEGDRVWIMEDRKLRIVPVKVARREKNTVLISSGLQGGEQVVLTPISGAADGLLLRTAEN
ncbi:efflux RND transporter periplasmic adaptor subunit [Geothermobacter hydrogeniphilus]|uniref:RND family efflux transporter, MFP subunit n=1 Tax=Geothermobacter hydrogeniphilus TaxID=1969733 RepID=A0A1X0Y028_9BACT|nr:efflux RND transporter periplasmic adaptor subunit [Geothermobacter hydrogeniphilus]ORJ58545.1 hypothetical protein B5V00_11895 [Geothermobacter hydrogeniphilus]